MKNINQMNRITKIQKKTDDYLSQTTDFMEETKRLKKALMEKKKEEDILVDAFALCSAALERTLGMRPYDEQILGAIQMAKGGIAEMKTGEGKTLAGVLPLYYRALFGKGTFCVTVNDYLAERDYTQMKPVFKLLGLTASIIHPDMQLGLRKYAYQCDITYGTHSEFGFDYLRDHLARSLEGQVQRGLYYAQLDEADSILIDEARTPLIISSQGTGGTILFKHAVRFVRSLSEEDIELIETEKRVMLTAEGIAKAEKFFKIDNYADLKNIRIVHAVEQTLYAEKMLVRDVDYLVKDDEIILIDAFTGRLMPGRRFSSGLHQALEAKEGCTIRPASKTKASITFQNFFRLFEHRSGMTGTAMSEADELWELYQMPVSAIPTHRPVIREDLPDRLFSDEKTKNTEILKEVLKVRKTGQPVLIGTLSVEQSETLSKLFCQYGIRHRLLNARQDEHEAEIIKKAGRHRAVTIATNMAGRGTDIRLDQEAEKAGGLYVIGTQRHDSVRIDNQLRGRSGRQGDPGKSAFFLSLDDPVIQFEDKLVTMQDTAEGEIPVTPKIRKLIEKAQRKVESRESEIRKNTFLYDSILDVHRKQFYNSRQEIIEKKSIDRMMFRALEESAFEAEDHDFDPAFLKQWDFHNSEWFEKSEHPKKRFMQQCAYTLKKEQEILGTSNMQALARRVLLNTMDEYWTLHLENMDMLRQGIGLRAYGQNDPQREYIRDGFELYRKMIRKIGVETVRKLCVMKEPIFKAADLSSAF